MPVSVRKLIIENNIHEAFQSLEPVVTGQLKNDLHLLWTQWVYWEKQSSSGITPSLVERSRIIYAVLQIVSELEGSKALQEMEVNLMNDFGHLNTLIKQGNIDKIMQWLLKEHPDKFNERVEYELSKRDLPLNATFTKNILESYISQGKLDISTEYLLKYIVDKYNSIPNFFNEWLLYSSKRMEVIENINHRIQHVEKKYYQKLILMGLLGGISGATLFAFFGDYIDIDMDDNDTDDDD